MLSKNSEQEYISRINDVLNYIQRNLEKELTLDKLARVACFSQFHFHRIFKSIVGESLYSFIKRLRLEKSAVLLKKNVDLTITEIAYTSGFSSSSNFAFAFKEHFGTTPSDFQKQGNIRKNENGALRFSANCYTKEKLAKFLEDNRNDKLYDDKRMAIDIKDLPGYHVVYVRHIGKYEDCETAWNTVGRWAGIRRLIKENTFFIGIPYDNPEITPIEKCRYDACISVPEGKKASGKVALADIPPGTFAVYRFEDKVDNIPEAYNGMFCRWLPQSGYQVDDRPCLEIHYNHPDDNDERHLTSDLCIPVIPL